MASSTEINCPTCTLLNPVENETCSMCDNTILIQKEPNLSIKPDERHVLSRENKNLSSIKQELANIFAERYLLLFLFQFYDENNFIRHFDVKNSNDVISENCNL